MYTDAGELGIWPQENDRRIIRAIFSVQEKNKGDYFVLKCTKQYVFKKLLKYT